MAVVFDAVGPNSGGQANGPSVTTINWSHTCTGSNLLLVVGVGVGSTNDASVTTTVKYNNVSMTSAGKMHSNNGTNGYVELFYLVNPTTGANTAVVTSNTSVTSLEGGSISFTGVDQTTPVSNATTAAGSGTTPTVNVSSATGNMVVDAVVNGSPIASSSQTNRWLNNWSNSSAAGNAAQSTAAGAASVTMSYTVTSDWWGIAAMNINAYIPPNPSIATVAWLTA